MDIGTSICKALSHIQLCNLLISSTSLLLRNIVEEFMGNVNSKVCKHLMLVDKEVWPCQS